MATGSPVAVFGGTGFLGHRIVRHLREHGNAVRIVARNPDRARTMFRNDPLLESIDADIREASSVTRAIDGASAVVNAVSLYAESGSDTFHRLHVACAACLASLAKRSGVRRLVHISGIGAEAASPSRYIRSRGEGEMAVRSAFPDAVIIRPAVMFAEDDAFASRIVRLLRRAPVYPLFGSGETRLQPVYAEDVAEAAARIISRADTPPPIFECGGPRVYTYKELVGSIAQAAGQKPMLIPVPFAVWYSLARVAEFVPNPPVAPNQVELMQVDNVSSPGLPGLTDIGIAPEPMETIVRSIATART